MNRAHADEDRTVGSSAAADAEPVAGSSLWGHTLPDGAELGEFEILGLIGEGGFGIVYRAYDYSLQREVALKEYMPSSIAARLNDGIGVAVKSPRHAEAFQAGLRSFVNEARLLAKFDHPSLVKVYRFWEGHGTAYMVMPYYQGPTLKAALAARAQPPDEATIRAWLRPLLDALAVMHAAQCFHRDIAPDNILLTPDGPLLLDFGAARRVIGDMTQALTVVLKPGYAPIEQYGDVPTMTQGPWTDLYALACVVRYAILGEAPVPSVQRYVADRLQPLARLAAGRYSDAFLRAIDHALAVLPQDRPQDVEQFRALLDASAAPAAPLPGPRPLRTPRRAAYRTAALVALGLLVATVAATAWWLTTAPAKPTTTATDVQPPAAAPIAVPAAPPPPAVAAEPPAPVDAAATPAAPVTTAPAEAAGRDATPPAPLDAAPLPPPAAEAVPPKAAAAAEAEAETPRRSARTPPPPTLKRPLPPRCTDILRKASLEPLSDEEAAFLRKECRR
jgi:serine/threonine protein kinase